MKTTIILLIALISSASFSADEITIGNKDVMTINRTCFVTKMGRLANDFSLRKGDMVNIVTTSNRDYMAPKMVDGLNSIKYPTRQFDGNKGKFYYQEGMALGNVFEMLSDDILMILRETSASPYTGKFKSVIYLYNEIPAMKVAELQCSEK